LQKSKLLQQSLLLSSVGLLLALVSGRLQLNDASHTEEKWKKSRAGSGYVAHVYNIEWRQDYSATRG